MREGNRWGERCGADATATDRRRAGTAIATALVAVVATSTSAARADLDPPAGTAWIREVRYSITNLDQFRDWLVVAWPCRPNNPEFTVDSYCVLREPGPYLLGGRLYALAMRGVQLRDPIDDLDDAGRARLVTWPDLPKSVRIVRPAWDLAEDYLEHHAAVVRSGFSLHDRRLSVAPEHSGVQSVVYELRIESIEPTSMKLARTAATYRCRNGTEIKQPWGPDQTQPPTPACPVFDDRGALTTNGVTPGPLVAIAPQQDGILGGPRWRFWIGAAIASASLLGAGLLLRRRSPPRPTSAPPNRTR